MCESIESGSCVGCSDDRILPEPFGSCFDIVHGYISRFVYILSLSRSRFLNSSSAAWYYVSRLSEWNTDVATSGHQDFRQGLSTFDSVSFVTKIAQTFFPRLYLIMLCFKKQLSTTLKRKKKSDSNLTMRQKENSPADFYQKPLSQESRGKQFIGFIISICTR